MTASEEHYGPVADRIKRGIALLDEQEPYWREHVVPEKLRMSHIHACVLGHVYGNYSIGLEVLGLPEWEQSAYHGFTIPDDINPMLESNEWRALEDAWLEELT